MLFHGDGESFNVCGGPYNVVNLIPFRVNPS